MDGTKIYLNSTVEMIFYDKPMNRHELILMLSKTRKWNPILSEKNSAIKHTMIFRESFWVGFDLI